MRYWLYKSEPTVYGIDHLQRDGTTIWDGVRNYQARNNLMAAALGDRVFIYHASADPPGIAGLAEVVETLVVDPLQFDPDSKYYDADLQPRRAEVDHGPGQVPGEVPRLPPPGHCSDRSFSTEELVTLRKGNRLSVTPVTDAAADRLLAMGRG